MNVQFFATPSAFRQWLEENHKTVTELYVGFYKVSSKKPSITWSQSVDQALCFGWIDGIRKSIDDESYCIRFTPRRKNSIWSAINIEKVEALTKVGLMTPEGLKAFGYRKENQSGIYSYEKKPDQLPKNYQQQFKNNKAAWAFFVQQAPSYQKNIMYWIMHAKQEKTRLSRLEKVIQASEKQKRLF